MEAGLLQLEQLFANLSLGRAKDLTLAADLKESNGAKSGKTIHEFLEQLEQFGKVSQWTDSDLVNITLSKLSGEAPTFVKGLSETELRGISYDRLKQKLVERFGETLPLQYYYTLLHEAKQEKAESPKMAVEFCARKRLRRVPTLWNRGF
jgi:hypothetical protein